MRLTFCLILGLHKVLSCVQNANMKQSIKIFCSKGQISRTINFIIESFSAFLFQKITIFLCKFWIAYTKVTQMSGISAFLSLENGKPREKERLLPCNKYLNNFKWNFFKYLIYSSAEDQLILVLMKNTFPIGLNSSFLNNEWDGILSKWAAEYTSSPISAIFLAKYLVTSDP